jgi:hypothetical protein
VPLIKQVVVVVCVGWFTFIKRVVIALNKPILLLLLSSIVVASSSSSSSTMMASSLSLVSLALCAIVATVLVNNAVALPMLDISGFSWAENLAFDNSGNLFVADAVTGKIWRIYLDPSSNTYKKTLHINAGFKGALGLAVTQNNSQVYCNVKLDPELHSDIGSYAIIAFNPSIAGSYQFVASLPEGGNGMRR